MRVQVMPMGSITTIQLVVVGWRLEMLTQCSATSNVYEDQRRFCRCVPRCGRWGRRSSGGVF